MADRSRFLLLALALYAACAVWATWPAIRHVDGAHYLARPAAGHGEAAAGDHLQLGWAFWLVGHQLERGASPLADPYSFRPEAEAPPSLQGWLLGVPYWPLGAAFGDVWAYDLIVLLDVRPRRRDHVLVAARARGVTTRGARRRRRLLPDALPGRPVNGPSPRADLVPAPGDAARARAPSLRARRSLPGGDSAVRPAPSRARRDPARARLRLGAPPPRALVEGGRGRGRSARRRARRRPVGGLGLDRHRTLLRAGRPLLRGALGLRHARASGAGSRSSSSSAG